MSRTLSLALRIFLAAAGLAYIAWTVHWTDQIVLPSGEYQTAEGKKIHLDRDQWVDISEPLRDPEALGEPLEVQIRTGDGRIVKVVVQPEQWGSSAESVRFRPGVSTTLRRARLDLLVLGFLAVGPIYPITAWRWRMLMRTRGLDITFSRAFRLSMIGCFFNYCMPGTTGGDVIKAYYAARSSDRRADAVMTVVIDRIAGLLGLVLLAGLAGLAALSDPMVRRLTVYIWSAAGGVTLISAFYFSRRLRARSGLDRLLRSWFPRQTLLGKIDEATVAYRDHKMIVLASILMSLPVHMCLALATSLAGWALGMKTPLEVLLVVVPILFLAGSLPLTYQGLGVMEGLGVAMLVHPYLATVNQVVGMLLVIRLYQILYSLTGAIFLLRTDVPVSQPAGGQGTA